MPPARYSMSFTTGTLLHRESVLLAGLYLQFNDWVAVRDRVVAANLLQARTVITLKRLCREVISRLKKLDANELNLLAHANHQEQACLLWLAICRRHPFIGDFAIEVLHEKFVTLRHDLTTADFDAFFNRKSEWHPELEKIKPSTLGKLRQVLFKIMREADFLSPSNTINPVMPTPAFSQHLMQHRPGDALFFPLFESDLKRMTP